MRKIKRNDKVIILTGKDKKKNGFILKYIKNNYVIVNNINIVKKTVKSDIKNNKIGGIIKKNMPIHVSNIAILNSKSKKKDKIKFKILNNKKNRIYKSNNKIVKD